MDFQSIALTTRPFCLQKLYRNCISICKFSIDKLHLLGILQISIIKKNLLGPVRISYCSRYHVCQSLKCFRFEPGENHLVVIFSRCHQLFSRQYVVKYLAIQNIALLVILSSVKFFFLNFQRKWLLKFSRYQFFPRFELGLLNSNCKLLSITP